MGLIDKKPLRPQKIAKGDILLIVGETKDELGGSEYYEYIHKFIGGKSPAVDFKASKKNMKTVLSVIKKDLVKAAHDPSKGGLAVAISELCMMNKIGCNVSLNKIPSKTLESVRKMFSETHSRYLIVAEKKNLKKLESELSKNKVPFGVIGKFGSDQIIFEDSKKQVDLSVDKAQKAWMNSLGEIISHA